MRTINSREVRELGLAKKRVFKEIVEAMRKHLGKYIGEEDFPDPELPKGKVVRNEDNKFK